VVAACWEFIIPGYGMDIPNIDAVSFAKIVSDSVETLGKYATYEDYYQSIEAAISRRFEAICAAHRNLYISPAPFLSLLMHGCVENAQDITLGGKYNNYGIHGTGIATAADSIAAIKKFYFEEKSITAEALAAALKNNFDGTPELYEKLRFEAPKMGHDDDYVDSIASALLASFDKSLVGAHNERGGIYRAGTGTAMYYIFHGAGLPATPDGRKADEVIPANYSPSLFVKNQGPVSVIKSFTKPDLKRTINGGPLTLEFDDSVFRNDESIQKLAMFVKSFITLGGHQLQLNTVDRDKLLDAQTHPERYRNLIVRVWGWSGYFVELDKIYQDHILKRLEYTL
jgi:formate C-acetyltransferase